MKRQLPTGFEGVANDAKAVIDQIVVERQQARLAMLKVDLEFITKTSARILDVLQRTTIGDKLSPEDDRRMTDLQDKVRASRHEIASNSDDFFSWHNEMLRRAREGR